MHSEGARQAPSCSQAGPPARGPAAFTSVALAAAAVAIPFLAATHSALARACCTNLGQRRVVVEKFDLGKQHDLSLIRFAPVATLFTGEGDRG
jgi:hypothetical protein